jgi:REP element-mobilizing transposase RayT
MDQPAPIYTRANCRFTGPNQWGPSVFWREPESDAGWFQALAAATEPDGIRLLGHRFANSSLRQFSVSTLAVVPPVFVVQRIKGRLQHLIRARRPKAFRGNYCIRSFGEVKREVVEQYVASQLDHHQMADERVNQALAKYQIVNQAVDLSQPRFTSHGMFWHNLHVVLVHRERWAEVREAVFQQVHEMIGKICRAKDYLLSRAGILADHVHLTLGCPIDVAPADVALSFLNNLAFVPGMKAIYQFVATSARSASTIRMP